MTVGVPVEKLSVQKNGFIRFYDQSTPTPRYVALHAPDTAAILTSDYKLPARTPTSDGMMLVCDKFGNMSWLVPPTGGGGGVPLTTKVTGGTSLAGGGALSTDQVLTLANDDAAPGFSKYFGTGPLSPSTKGFFPIGVDGQDEKTDSHPVTTNDASGGTPKFVVCLDHQSPFNEFAFEITVMATSNYTQNTNQFYANFSCKTRGMLGDQGNQSGRLQIEGSPLYFNDGYFSFLPHPTNLLIESPARGRIRVSVKGMANGININWMTSIRYTPVG